MKKKGRKMDDELLARIFTQEATEEEIQAFARTKPEEFEKLKKLQALLDQIQPPVAENRWAELLQKMEEESPSQQNGYIKNPLVDIHSTFSAFQRMWRIAAVVLVTLASLWWVYGNYFTQTEVKTPNGKHATVHLVDGTVVELNAASKLRYPKKFSDKLRKVRLMGEAFFKVAPGSVPFTVETQNALVQVLGSAFNLRQRGNTTTVVVQLGKLAIANLESVGKVVLHSGEMSQVVDTSLPTPPVKVDISKMTAWREGKLIFERTPLHVVFEELTRQFDVKFKIAVANMTNLTLTAKYNKGLPVDQILRHICANFNLKSKKINGAFQIDEDGGVQ